MPPEYRYFDIPAGTKIKILSEDGVWLDAEVTGKAIPGRSVVPDYRRAWINLAEAIREMHAVLADKSPWDLAEVDQVADQARKLPIDQANRELVHMAFYNGLGNGLGVDGAAMRVAMVLTGQPEFDVSRFLHHATSDDPDGKWSYQVANPEGEWSRDPENPEDCLKIDIESA